MIWTLLRKNISIGQIAGYALACLIGLTIVECAIRFYGDVKPAFATDTDDESSLLTHDYMVISKPVTLLNTLGKGNTEFTPAEIGEIAAQPWATAVGEFVSADFNVACAVELGGRGMQSYMFLESIPDAFVDIKPDDWNFDPQDGTASVIPIILAKDYLALYNFGFAASRGLPQLNEGLISQVPIMLQLSGNGHIDVYRARIVGFSSRLNTIAVPENFMTWANERYAGHKPSQPSRLIIRISNPGNPEIEKFMADHGYEVAGDKLDTGKASFFLTMLTSILVTIGAIIAALALFILMLSTHLLLQKNRDKISVLLMLGYTPAQVSAGYYKLVGTINAAVLVAATAMMLILSRLWQAQLSQLSIVPSSPLWAMVTAIVIMAAITAANFIAIRRAVIKAYR